jgi:hypothetical protein
MRRPLGCLTFSALIAVVLVVLAILGASAVTGNGIFSPGRLSAVAQGSPLGGVTSHAGLEGRCEACHAAAWSSERMGDLCLTCHATVKEEIATRGGLHGRLAASATTCRDCHTEHRGATAAVTLADPRVFPHEQTGFALAAHPLRSQGGGVGCRDCHPGSPTTFSPPTCVACHQALDQPFMALHQETFGTACLNCHDGVDSYGAAFNHATYPLTGGHQGPQCGTCHKGATTVAALQATSTECVACHAAKDIHQGRLGTNCAECHTTANWTDATIDHNRTRFRLVGQHDGALCESCHVDRHWTGIGLTCRSCHAAVNPHGDQFPGDCAACHAATGWKDVTFDHATTRFSLTLAHAKPACVACHAGGRYVGTSTECSACHTRPSTHGGSAFSGTCSSCHTTKAWLPASFNHAKTAFPLTGFHLSTTCQKCHQGGVLKGTPTACSACHTKPSSHGSAFSGSCATCHTTKAWLPASFNHNKAKFVLTGAHRSVTCQKCHTGNQLKGTPTACSACHTKPSSHGSAYSGTCSTCHTTRAWLPASFNHSKAAFPLTGAHASVTCQKCHKGGVFKGTPTACSACHARPSSHGSAFSGACSSCHTTRAWLPASYSGPHTFPQSHGGAGGVCSKCHPSSLSSYSCAKCHSNSSMTSHHSGVSGFSLTTCVKCHPTGRAGD